MQCFHTLELGGWGQGPELRTKEWGSGSQRRPESEGMVQAVFGETGGRKPEAVEAPGQ